MLGSALGGLGNSGYMGGWEAQQQAAQAQQQISYWGASGGGCGGNGMTFISTGIKPKTEEKEKISMIGHLKNYIGANRDLIFNIVLIILIDHFVFNGAFKHKIQTLVDRFLDRTHKIIDVDPNKKEA